MNFSKVLGSTFSSDPPQGTDQSGPQHWALPHRLSRKTEGTGKLAKSPCGDSGHWGPEDSAKAALLSYLSQKPLGSTVPRASSYGWSALEGLLGGNEVQFLTVLGT